MWKNRPKWPFFVIWPAPRFPSGKTLRGLHGGCPSQGGFTQSTFPFVPFLSWLAARMGFIDPPSRLDASFELVSKCRLHTKYRALSIIIITRSAQLGSLSSRSLLSPLAINPSRIAVLREVKIPSARFLSLKIQTRRSRKDSHPGSSEEVFVDSLY